MRHATRAFPAPAAAMATRAPIEVEVWAWTESDPARLLTGVTVELGDHGAVLRLPKLYEAAARLTLRITLPDRPVLTEATVLSRANGSLVTVRFVGLGSYERFRILEFPRRAALGGSGGCCSSSGREGRVRGKRRDGVAGGYRRDCDTCSAPTSAPDDTASVPPSPATRRRRLERRRRQRRSSTIPSRIVTPPSHWTSSGARRG